MEEEYRKLDSPVPLAVAVRRFGLERLHPMDKCLLEEMPEGELRTAQVTMVRRIEMDLENF